MHANEANKLTNESITKSGLLDDAFRLIETRAREGKFTVSLEPGLFTSRNQSQEVATALNNMGYKVLTNSSTTELRVLWS